MYIIIYYYIYASTLFRLITQKSIINYANKKRNSRNRNWAWNLHIMADGRPVIENLLYDVCVEHITFIMGIHDAITVNICVEVVLWS